MSIFTKSVESILLRDLGTLEQELIKYNDDDSVWTLAADIKNSTGTLCLHLCGNLQHYIGVGLGGSTYQRDRDKEFSLRNIPRATLLKEIAAARHAVSLGLSKITPDMLETDYPLPVYDYPMSIQHFMIHLCAHFGYHLGQVNYHRRLMDA
jgi:hypothetical protein